MVDVFENNMLVKRAYWLIRLRWIATICVVLETFILKNILGFTLLDPLLYGIAALLAIYNSIMWLLLNYSTKNQRKVHSSWIKKTINFQIFADLFILTTMLHFSGGIENPFSFFYIFHVIIASILLSTKESYLVSTFAVIAFGLLIFLEYLQIIPHHCLNVFEKCIFQDKVYMLGTYFVFIISVYIVVYLANDIATRLKKAEEIQRENNILLCKKDRIKDEYVLHVTHDIKAHLAAIQSCLDVVAKKLTGPLNDQQQDFINSADMRTRKLTHFVKSLLRLTKMRLDNNLEMSVFSLNDTIYSALASVKTKAQEKNITLNSDIDPSADQILGSQFSIEEVIVNLLFNAIKYTNAYGTVEIKTKKDGNNILVEVIDSGIGIPQKELANVFDEFYRATNAKKLDKNGTGLGLSMAKQIIESHHGTIWIDSQEGVGTKLSFTLPQNNRS